MPDETQKVVNWSAAPQVGQVVEFSLYFVEPGATTRWDQGETVVGELVLERGKRVILLRGARQPPPGFLTTVEGLLRDNVFRMNDPSKFAGGPLLWVTQSEDPLHGPMIVDLPVPIGPEIATEPRGA